MARIRSIHPTLSTDEAFMAMTITAKAVWPMLWMECDDSGVFEWKPIVLKARLLPADNVDMAAVLSEYESLNTVMKFEVDGREYGVIRNFVRFQRPKDPKSVHPTPPAVLKYAGFNDDGSRPNAGTGRPSTGGKEKVLPKSFVTTSEVQPQMKEEGGSKEEVEEKDAPAPNGAHSEEFDFFARGKSLLGKSSGGLLKNLLKAKNGNIPLARAALETSSTKADPREYLGAIVRSREEGTDLRAKGEAW